MAKYRPQYSGGRYTELTVTRLYDNGTRNGMQCYQFTVTDSKGNIVMQKNRWLATMVIDLDEVATRHNVSVIHSKFGTEYRIAR